MNERMKETVNIIRRLEYALPFVNHSSILLITSSGMENTAIEISKVYAPGMCETHPITEVLKATLLIGLWYH